MNKIILKDFFRTWALLRVHAVGRDVSQVDNNEMGDADVARKRVSKRGVWSFGARTQCGGNSFAFGLGFGGVSLGLLFCAWLVGSENLPTDSAECPQETLKSRDNPLLNFAGEDREGKSKIAVKRL